MVTTWASQCGIATYSEGLCSGLKKHEVMPIPLVPQRVARTRNVPGFAVSEAWDRDDRTGGNLNWLSDVAKDLELDALHFQHEFGLFRDSTGFLRAVRALSKKLPVVITLHTPPLSTHVLGRFGWLSGLRRHASAIICHTIGGAASVAVTSGSALVRHIDHGTPSAQPGDPQQGLKILGLNRTPSSLGIALGFVSGSKNVACTVLAFGDALARKMVPPDAVFFVAGSSQGDIVYTNNSLRPALDYTGAAGINLHFLDHFIKDEEIPHVLAAVDYGVLNTLSDNLSASGQVHQLATYGVAAAVANKPIYAEGIIAGAIPFEVSPNLTGSRPDHPTASLVAAIGALASDKALRAACAQRMAAYGKATAWSVIAGKHAALYKELLG